MSGIKSYYHDYRVGMVVAEDGKGHWTDYSTALRLQQERDEQAKLLGAGVERELRLTQERDRLKSALEMVRDYVVVMKGRGHAYQIEIDEALASIKE